MRTPTHVVAARVDAEVHDQLLRAAEAERRPLAQFIKNILTDWSAWQTAQQQSRQQGSVAA